MEKIFTELKQMRLPGMLKAAVKASAKMLMNSLLRLLIQTSEAKKHLPHKQT